MASNNQHASRPIESQFVDVEAWTEGALEAIASLSLSSSPVIARHYRRVSAGLAAIPLDDEVKAATVSRNPPLPLRRKTSNRDSMRRRELLLKGNEGTRRRQKWENGTTIVHHHHHPALSCET
jgi:hypothetical protein